MTLPIDLDTETICFDGNWLTRDQLAGKIRSMLEAGDFAVTKPSQALEQLTNVLSNVTTLEVKLTSQMVESLHQAAARHGKTVGALIRHALARNLLDDANALAEAEASDAAVPNGHGAVPTEGWVVRDTGTRRPKAESEPLPGPATAALLLAQAASVDPGLPVVQGHLPAEPASAIVTEAVGADDQDEPVELKPKRRAN